MRLVGSSANETRGAELKVQEVGSAARPPSWQQRSSPSLYSKLAADGETIKRVFNEGRSVT